MADWSAIRTVLQSWVEARTGLQAFWRERPRSTPWTSYILLSIGGRMSVGNDDIDVEYDDTAAAGSEIRTYQTGQRRFTLSVQVRTYQQSDDVDAMHYTSLLRDSTSLPTVSAAFRAAGISFSRGAGETDIQAMIDGREMSVAEIDLRFNAASQVEDTATGYIEELDDFTLEAPAGTTIWQGDIEVL